MVLGSALGTSMGSLHSSGFELELEAAILQQTAAVDHYLQTAAPKWSPTTSCATAGSSAAATEQACAELHALFLADASLWQQYRAVSGGLEIVSCSEEDGVFTAAAPPPPPPTTVAGPVLLPIPSRRLRQQQHLELASARDAQLQQFLRDDVQRMLQEQAAAADAALLVNRPVEQQQRPQARSSASSSCVRLPSECGDWAGEVGVDDGGAAAGGECTAAAAAYAAASALAAASNLASSPDSPSAALRAAAAAAAATASAAAAAAAAAPQQHATAAAAFAMEAEEDVAAQKAAARARLAELQQQGGARGSSIASSAARAKDKDGGWTQHAAGDSMHGGSSGAGSGCMHDTVVPERPRGLVQAARHQQRSISMHAAPLTLRAALQLMWARLFGPAPFQGGGLLQQHAPFLQCLRACLACCGVLLPLLWALQPAGGAGSSGGAGLLRSMLPPAVAARAEQWSQSAFLVAAAAGLLYCLARSLLSPPPLRFAQPELEQRFALWHNSGRVASDALFQLLYLLAGSCMWQRLQQDGGPGVAAGHGRSGAAAAAPAGQLLLSGAALLGAGVPVLTLLAMRNARYVVWREQLIAGGRLLSVAALALAQLVAAAEGAGDSGDAGAAAAAAQLQLQLQLSMPLLALAQLMTLTSMQVRLATFAPYQIAQVLLLLLRSRPAHPLLHLVQLLGGSLCMPCLLLHRMELHARTAFVVTLGLAPKHEDAALSASAKAV